MRLQIYFIPTVCWGVVSVLIKKCSRDPEQVFFQCFVRGTISVLGSILHRYVKKLVIYKERARGKTYQFSSSCVIKYGENNTYFVSYYMRQKRVIKSPIYVKIMTKKSREQHGDESKNIFDWYYEIFSVFYLKVCSMYQTANTQFYPILSKKRTLPFQGAS